MSLQKIIVLTLLLGSVTAGADPAPEKKLFMHKDANGRMVFTDKQDEGGAVLQISKPSVVTDSKLGVKAYSRQTPRSYDRTLADEQAARAAANRSYAREQEQQERQRSRCDRLREIAHQSQYGGAMYRSTINNQYDHECIANGY
jgi:hypothetical protein